MKFIGEHLLPGQIGHFMVILSFVASLIATISYFKSANSKNEIDSASWKRLARIAFIIDAVSVCMVFGIIFFIISQHYFEYYYAWNHSDTSLDTGYLLSSIWEGQEGSFLLWAIWHAVLGIVLIKTSGKWEAPVMTVLSFAQMCLATMVLGVYFFDYRIGSNPFILLRDSGVLTPVNAPLLYDLATGVLRNDYLGFIYKRDGTGLNQLLQNYWMVIHPPVLFLGFASTIVPFSFAIGGLWKRDFAGWTKVALPWSLFATAVLGTGILMGAAWAYESLTFGGYWAWDPVENASLVPWLLLISGLHTQMIFNSTGHSLRSMYLFFILTFILILYSTFLTRSGILGDTSVHAFTDLGMNIQLLSFLFIFLVPSIILYATRYKQIPFIAKEESSYSREFWMFIGSLVFFLSGLFIISATSLPVINKIFGTNFTVGEDVEFSYNRILIFVAIVIGILTAITQYLKYKSTNKKYLVRKLFLPTLISLAISLLIAFFGNIDYGLYGIGFLGAIHIALFAAVYMIVANAGYIWLGLNGKLKAAGASVAHFGFGVMLLGILISSSKKTVLSVNRLNPLNFGENSKESGFENLTLFRGVRTDMGKFWATYVRDTSGESEKKIYFEIEIERKNGKEKFSLFPHLIRATKGQEGFSNNPDSKHYWHKDIFSYISYADKMDEGEDTAQFKRYPVALKDTIFYSTGYIIFDTVVVNPRNDKYNFSPADTAIMAQLNVVSMENRRYTARPVYYIKNNQVNYILDSVFAQGLAIGFSKVLDNKHIEITVKESSRLAPFVALKVLEFPFINFVWLGALLMVTGITMSIVRRVRGMKGSV